MGKVSHGRLGARNIDQPPFSVQGFNPSWVLAILLGARNPRADETASSDLQVFCFGGKRLTWASGVEGSHPLCFRVSPVRGERRRLVLELGAHTHTSVTCMHGWILFVALSALV